MMFLDDLDTGGNIWRVDFGWDFVGEGARSP